MTASEYLKQFRASKDRRKYRNKPTEYTSPLCGARTYPSKRQVAYAAELDRRWQAKEIPWWLPEVPIALGCETDGGRQRVMRVDFLVGQWDGPPLWQDTKGVATEAWEVKRDLVRARYGIEVEIIK
jgi:hypothetical protein